MMTPDPDSSDSGSSAAEGSSQPVRKRRTIVGTVRSDKMRKTITVEVTRLEKHVRYHKYIRRRSSYYAHDENEDACVGDLVRIAETRPLSKSKRWRFVEVVRPVKRG